MHRIPQLDGIRGIAILLVLIWHYAFGIWAGVEIQPEPKSAAALVLRALSFSWSGVDLFFVLSGFLIGGILIDTRDEPNYFSRFYIRRAFRILPLYFAALLVGIAVGQEGPRIPAIWYLTITQNIWMAVNNDWNVWFGQVWSLGVEEQFYLLLPLLLWVSPRDSMPGNCLCFIALAIMIRWAMLATGLAGTVSLHVLFPARMDALFIGVLCASLYRDHRGWLDDHRKALYITLAGTAAVLLLMMKQGWTLESYAMGIGGYTILAVFYACFLLIAVTETSGPVSALTKLVPLRRLGILAYFLFLMHVLIPQVIFRAMGRSFEQTALGDWLLLLASAGVVVALAEVSWRYFERPLIELGRTLGPQARSATKPASI